MIRTYLNCRIGNGAKATTPCSYRTRTSSFLRASSCRRTLRAERQLASDLGHYGPTYSGKAQRTLEGMDDSGYDGGLGLTQPAVGAQRLDTDEAIRLLASVEFGRVVFTVNSLPAIRPVNHLLDDGRIIIRARLTSAISSRARSADGIVVAYEADSIDPHTRSGWSVVATGRAYTITDPYQVLLRTAAPPVGKPRQHRRRHRTQVHHWLPLPAPQPRTPTNGQFVGCRCGKSARQAVHTVLNAWSHRRKPPRHGGKCRHPSATVTIRCRHQPPFADATPPPPGRLRRRGGSASPG